MAGLLLHAASHISCSHGGEARALTPNPRVLIEGQPTVLITTLYSITGCSETSGPCLSGRWSTGTTRVFSNGQPLAFTSSGSICDPTGTPLSIAATQNRVTAL